MTDTMKTKREKFEALDELVLDAMTKALMDDDTDVLRDLNVAVTYLKNNQVITPPKEESTMHDSIESALANK